jgi:hypothetical protein
MKIILENMDDIDNYLRIFYTPTCKVKPDSRAPQEHSAQTAHLLGKKKNNHLTLALTRENTYTTKQKRYHTTTKIKCETRTHGDHY